MEFRANTAAAQTNVRARDYLTRFLSDKDSGLARVNSLLDEMGNSVEVLPSWHPIMTYPRQPPCPDLSLIYTGSALKFYRELGLDHTVFFVSGLVACPYSEENAQKLVEGVNKVSGLSARCMDEPLYADNAFPVVVKVLDMRLETDGTILKRDALTMFLEVIVKHARDAQVAETWWTMKDDFMGIPCGSRSSLCVNQSTGGQMRKILESLNKSGIFGPIKERGDLTMLSESTRERIVRNLVTAAIFERKKNGMDEFEFELCGETCLARFHDTWGDGVELQISVSIGEDDLYSTAWYWPEKEKIETSGVLGKKAMAIKFDAFL